MVRYIWATRVELGTITSVTGAQVARLLEAFPRVAVLLAVGGFPCKGLSSSNIFGEGIQNAQGVLLFEFVRVLRELEQTLF